MVIFILHFDNFDKRDLADIKTQPSLFSQQIQERLSWTILVIHLANRATFKPSNPLPMMLHVHGWNTRQEMMYASAYGAICQVQKQVPEYARVMLTLLYAGMYMHLAAAPTNLLHSFATGMR